MSINRILVAVDGSANSLAAVRWAAAIATDLHAEVTAVHALGLLDRTADDHLQPCQPHRQEIASDLEHAWTIPLRAAGVHFRCITRDGPPAAVVLDVAAEADVDLIVIGSRGGGRYPELLLGSTSTQVAQLSTRPVAIVPLTDDL